MSGEKSKEAECCSPWIALCICGGAGLWIGFYNHMRSYNQQQPAMCVEGRPMGETFTNSRFGVDDNMVNEGAVTMRCSFPVAVYQCWDDQINYEEWDGHCRSTLDSHPMFADDEWPRRMEKTEVTCLQSAIVSLGSNACSEKAWSCSTGACDAYEKSMRLCAAMIRQQPYKCFAFEGEPSAGVRDEAVGSPVGWLIGGILVSSLAIACLVFSVFRLSQHADRILNFCVFLGGFLTTTACICTFVGIVVAVTSAIGEPGTKGLIEIDYADLAKPAGTNITEVAAEHPPSPEGTHWAIRVLIVVGFLCGTCLVFPALLTVIIVCANPSKKKLASVSLPAKASRVAPISGPVTVVVAPMVPDKKLASVSLPAKASVIAPISEPVTIVVPPSVGVPVPTGQALMGIGDQQHVRPTQLHTGIDTACPCVSEQFCTEVVYDIEILNF